MQKAEILKKGIIIKRIKKLKNKRIRTYYIIQETKNSGWEVSKDSPEQSIEIEDCQIYIRDRSKSTTSYFNETFPPVDIKKGSQDLKIVLKEMIEKSKNKWQYIRRQGNVKDPICKCSDAPKKIVIGLGLWGECPDKYNLKEALKLRAALKEDKQSIDLNKAVHFEWGGHAINIVIDKTNNTVCIHDPNIHYDKIDDFLFSHISGFLRKELEDSGFMEDQGLRFQKNDYCFTGVGFSHGGTCRYANLISIIDPLARYDKDVYKKRLIGILKQMVNIYCYYNNKTYILDDNKYTLSIKMEYYNSEIISKFSKNESTVGNFIDNIVIYIKEYAELEKKITLKKVGNVISITKEILKPIVLRGDVEYIDIEKEKTGFCFWVLDTLPIKIQFTKTKLEYYLDTKFVSFSQDSQETGWKIEKSFFEEVYPQDCFQANDCFFLTQNEKESYANITDSIDQSVKKYSSSSITIQTIFRKHLDLQRKTATNIQKIFRRNQERKRFQKIKRGFIKTQKIFRGHKERKQFQERIKTFKIAQASRSTIRKKLVDAHKLLEAYLDKNEKRPNLMQTLMDLKKALEEKPMNSVMHDLCKCTD